MSPFHLYFKTVEKKLQCILSWTDEYLSNSMITFYYICFTYVHKFSMPLVTHQSFIKKKMERDTFQRKLQMFSSVTQLCPTLCDPVDCSMLGFPVHHQLLELAQTHVCRVGDDIQPPHPLSSSSPPAFKLSQHQGLYQWVSSSHQVAKYSSFSFSISPSNECSWYISFRVDWFDLPEVQRTLKTSPTPKFKSINS